MEQAGYMERIVTSVSFHPRTRSRWSLFGCAPFGYQPPAHAQVELKGEIMFQYAFLSVLMWHA